MRGTLFALALCLIASSASALTIDQAHKVALPQVQKSNWGFAQDSWKLTDDKAAHFGMAFASTTLSAWAFRDETAAERRGILAGNLIFWTLWEIKDGFGGYKESPLWGEGFSFPDLGYSAIACLLAMAIR